MENKITIHNKIIIDGDVVGKVKEVDGETYAIIKDYGLTTKELREIAKMIDNKIKKKEKIKSKVKTSPKGIGGYAKI